jgi:NarL family two-component system sensor histidine kinase LiaS
MANNGSRSKGKRGLRWKLTMSYTVVTVGALLAVEIILLVAASALISTAVINGTIPALVIESLSVDVTPILRAYLAESPPDKEGLTTWLEQLESMSVSVPLDFDATERLFIVGAEGQLLAARPADLFGTGQIGGALDSQVIPGLAEPLQAALAGEDNPDKLFALDRPGERVILVIPIWDANHTQVLGVLGGLADYPTITSVLREIISILGFSLLAFTLIAGLIGTLFGYLAARDPVLRLNRLVKVAQAWGLGDFTEFVEDPAGDELGQLTRQLNEMAQELEHLLETRKELAVVEERNRLARELHDSAKQQAFAAAAQISGIRALIGRDPAAAEAHLIQTEHIIDQLRQELTSLIFELRPAELDSQGLAPALDAYVAEWARQNQIGAELRLKGERPLPIEIEQALFRIAQEALANVARHSQAENVEIALIFNLDHLILTVTDDGQGFDIKSRPTGFGLHSMKQRAEFLGGEFTINPGPGNGTTLTCKMPLLESDRNGLEVANG